MTACLPATTGPTCLFPSRVIPLNRYSPDDRAFSTRECRLPAAGGGAEPNNTEPPTHFDGYEIIFADREYGAPSCLNASIQGGTTERSKGFPTLGIFRPKSIDRLVIKSESPTWTKAQLVVLRQEHLFDKRPATELEKIPFSFRYEFRCEDEKCNGHRLFCTDWEMGESYRKWRAQYGDRWKDKFRQRYESDMIGKFDTHFFVGTVHLHPQTWIICGLFYPPRSASGPTLFPI